MKNVPAPSSGYAAASVVAREALYLQQTVEQGRLMGRKGFD